MAVRLDVVLGRMLGMLGGMEVMTMRGMRVVGGLFVVARGVMLCGFAVMARSMLVVLRCLMVVICGFLRHGEILSRVAISSCKQGLSEGEAAVGVTAERIGDENLSDLWTLRRSRSASALAASDGSPSRCEHQKVFVRLEKRTDFRSCAAQRRFGASGRAVANAQPNDLGRAAAKDAEF